MRMKIDGHSPPVDAEAARRLESPKTVERSSGSAPAQKPGGSTDRVEVSSDAQLIAAAVQAAHESPTVRAEAVERGRRVLDQGALGEDTARLADRIIDSLLKSAVDRT